jgi:D-threo-aldose 1-dehydrogenase
MPTPLATRRRVGRTALEVPALGLGTAHLGELYAPVPEPVARAMLEAAWDGGVRLFDTAPWYGRGLAEHRLGGFLRAMPRAAFQVITKVGRTLHRPADPARLDRAPWVGGLAFEVRFDYSRDGVLRSYEQALQRLALDTVDALVIHDLDAGYHGDGLAGHRAALAEGGLAALRALKVAGEIKAFGMGVNTREAFDTVAAEVELDFLLVAMPYTLLDQTSLRGGMARCVDRGVGVIIGAPFASGILAAGSAGPARYGYATAPEAVKARVRAIEAVCAAHGVALAAAALQFPLAHPAVAAVIPGAARPEEVAANLAAAAAPIPTAFWADLRAGGLIDPDAPVPAGP